MKNKKHIFTILYLIMSLVLLPLRVCGDSSVTIDIKTREDLSKEDLDGRSLCVWKLNPNVFDTSMDKTRLNELLANVSDEDLDRQLENPNYKWILYPKEGSDYKVKLNNLSPGLYYVREIGNKDRLRYPLSAIFSAEDTSLVRLKWGNRITPPPGNPPGNPPENPPKTFLLIKTDEAGLPLAGAKFTLHQENGEQIRTKNFKYDPYGYFEVFETGKDGKILISDLPAGTYFFKEIEAPFGYQIEKEDNDFIIFEEEASSLRVINKRKKGSINFLKTDETGKNPLAGAQFTITQLVDGKHIRLKDDKGKELRIVSGKDGRFFANGLKYGNYYIWETKAPEGYSLLNTGLEFKIDDESSDKVLVIKNRKTGPIPKTGDITLIILIIAGGIMIGLGRYLIKEE